MDYLQLKKLARRSQENLPVIKIAVLADSTTTYFCEALKGYGHHQGYHFDIWEADYDQINQTVLDENSGLYRSRPDFVIIYHSSRRLLTEFYKRNAAEKKGWAEQWVSQAASLVDMINSRITSHIIYLNFPEINDAIFGAFSNKTDVSFLYQVRLLNVALMKLATEKRNLSIGDLSSIQNMYGQLGTVSDKMYITSDCDLGFDILPAVARHITGIILAYRGSIKKCLILDLDNTLWGGIIGDDGLEGIQIGYLGIGKAYTRLQAWIKQLKERGIILAVCSKNTEHIAREPFEKHPDMLLKTGDIAVFVANWNNKPDNIRYIQSVLNIGFDSMVFLDDSPFEREMVKKEIPELTVPDLPEDAAEYLTYLWQQNYFETTSYTEEDVIRNEQYREEARRVEHQFRFTNEDEYLESLEMEAMVRPIDKFSLPRVAQLTQRSNQFNLRTIRYTEAQLQALAEDSRKFIITISLKDKFGDYGLISVLILSINDQQELFIDTWIMSCRVLKRNVELLALDEIVTIAKMNGCHTIVGEYIPTPKNGLVRDHYSNLGFRAKEPFWELKIADYKPRKLFINRKN